jgi:hypothetical protein
MLRYRIEIQDAGMPMRAASASMPMPSFPFLPLEEQSTGLILEQKNIR